MTQHLLQIETVGPEGDKVIWIILLILIGLGSYFIFKKQKAKIHNPFRGFSFNRRIKITVEKNKKYHPSSIILKLENKTRKSCTIENPILRFRKGKNTKAFKIKNVNSSSIYPLYLKTGETHSLPVSLASFYDYDQKLKRYTRLRIEITYNSKQTIKSRYIILKSTLFRKAK